MTPRELDPAMTHAKLALLRQLVEDLQPLRGVTAEEFASRRVTRYAVERILTQLVDLAVSVNSHLAVAVLGRAPGSYRDSFVLAAQAGVISAELAEQLAPSVGLRNVLTHEYVAVDLEVVARSVGPAAAGFGRYVAEVASFLAGQPSQD